MQRRALLQAVGLTAGLSLLGVSSLNAANGFELVNPPQATDDPKKIEILEFFHYGCPHCRELDPLVEQWQKHLPPDVVFKRVPVTWNNDKLVAFANFYLATEALGITAKLHPLVFAAIQDNRVRLDQLPVAQDWVAKQGGNPKQFADAYNAFSVKSQLQRVNQLAQNYKITGVPTLVVNGRFVTSASMTGSHESALKMVDQLIARIRSERGGRP
jgi:thiol:disulfide interchange protein DsbA